MSDVSRSLPFAVALAAEKLSSLEVSVKEIPLRLARTGVSFTPPTVAVNVWLALAVPSVTLSVKFSVWLAVALSRALSFGTYR